MNCYYCGEPLTSDDYKEDKVVSDSNDTHHAHWSCVVKSYKTINLEDVETK